jgi:glucose/arabinose dehydrogenase
MVSNKNKIIVFIVILIALVILFRDRVFNRQVDLDQNKSQTTVINSPSPTPNIANEEVVATNLNIPWDISFLSDGYLITERVGNLVYLKNNGEKKSIKLPHPVPKGEGGLLGITLHPNFDENKYLYLYMTTSQGSSGTKNAVYRYKFINDELTDEKIIIKDIPGAIYHDGGRMEFGPDGYLYITTGDATQSNIAQDKNSLGGKILRLYDDGRIPEDNQFKSAIYSYGHRNPQGLAWDSEGRLWETEHGRSGATSGMDELNLIEIGKNYGWPTIEGDKTKEGMVTPAINSGVDDTWAPASALYYNGSIFFGGLKGEALYEAVLEGDKVKNLKTHLKNKYGRIRTVRLGKDGMFYITTSNRDGRGTASSDDDKLIRINPKSLVI